MPPAFNLIEEPFIPCIRTNGEPVEYGLREALLKAHEIAELRDDSPLVTVALHRLLLAILHRSYEGPRKVADRLAIWATGRFDGDKIDSYLSKAHCADRFDLFHPRYPFYQTAQFKSEEPSGINRLAQELSRGNNAALFDHTTDDPPPAMTPGPAARLIIAEQAFAIGGGKSPTGNTTHAPLVSGAIVLVRGKTLFETLWLNLTVYDCNQRPVVSDLEDAPVWERPFVEPHKQPSSPYGYLDFLTWQSRTLRVQPESGDEKVLVRRVFYAQGRKFEPEGGFFNPMIAYSRQQNKEPWQPVRFKDYRDLWRDSAAIYCVRDSDNAHEFAPRIVRDLASEGLRDVLPTTARFKVSVFGLCTDKAKVNFWRHESLPLPLEYLEDANLVGRLKEALKIAEEVTADALRRAIWATIANRMTGDSGMNPDTDRVRATVDSFAPERLYWSRLELPYRELIVKLADASSAEDRTLLIQRWFFDTVKPAAIDAFENTIGRLDSARDLKAVTAGRGMLHALLKKVQKANLVAGLEQQSPQVKEGVA